MRCKRLRQRRISRSVVPSARRRSVETSLAVSCPWMMMMCGAQLGRRPPRLSRCRVIMHDEAGIGATPATIANAASSWTRLWWDHTVSTVAATIGPTPVSSAVQAATPSRETRCGADGQRLRRGGLGCVELRSRQESRSSSSRTLKWTLSAHTYTKSQTRDVPVRTSLLGLPLAGRRVITNAYKPAPMRKTSVSARSISPEDLPSGTKIGV